jgi:hypothetical protein
MKFSNLILLAVCCAAIGSAMAQSVGEKPWERAARLEKARNNKEPQQITPDMCVDGICVEQDLGLVPTNLVWNAPEPMLNTKQLSAAQKSAYEDGVKRGRETCIQSNGAIWGAKADRLCDYLIFGNSKPRAELIAFFRDNKLPVCYPGDKKFKLALTTALGSVRFEVDFSIDGRPKVSEVVKEFIVLNDADKAAMRKLIQDKHPYLFSDDRYPPWGGYVEYDDGMYGRGPYYRLKGRSSIFANPRTGPDAGQCAIASKSLSVK